MRRPLSVVLVLLIGLAALLAPRWIGEADHGRGGTAGAEGSRTADAGPRAGAELEGAPAAIDDDRREVGNADGGEVRGTRGPSADASAATPGAAGAGLSGRVVWPGGAPAVGADVALEWVRDRSKRYPSLPRTRTDEDGRFTLALDGDHVGGTIRKYLRGKGTRSARLRAWKLDGAGAMHAAGLVDADDIDEEVILTLEPVPTVRGRVVALDGGAVGPFTARLQPGSGSVAGIDRDTVGLAAVRGDAKDGTFALPVSDEGVMRLVVEASGHLQREPTLLDLPADAGREHVVVLIRAARLAGVVRAPDGAPCPEAEVRVLDASAPEFFSGVGLAGDARVATSDAEGRFEFDGLKPGLVHVVADHEAWAPSAEVPAELTSGAEAGPLEVFLRRGGALHVRILDPTGEPVAGASLTAVHVDSMTMEHQVADEEGLAVLERLAPGTWQIQALPDDDPEIAPRDAVTRVLMEQVEVVGGEVTEVVLGGEQPDAVRVHGVVIARGEPVDAELTFLPDAGAGKGRGVAGIATGRTEEEGRYAVQVSRPGAYLVVVGSGPDVATPTIRRVQVPAVPEFRLDLELPAGAISGRVLEADGSPRADVVVAVQRTDALVNGVPAGLISQGVTTGADGGYRIELLAPGTYSVVVGGGSFFALFDSAQDGGAMPLLSRSGIRVTPGEEVTGVDLRFADAGRLAGRVIDEDGKPVPGATVWIRASNGEVLERLSMTASDATGRFPARSLLPGDYSVLARTDALAAADSTSVRVAAGETATVEVVCVRGVALQAHCVPADGAAPLPGVAVELYDTAGRALHGLAGQDAYQELYGTGFSAIAPRLGVFPPGTYRVVASCPDGRRGEAEVTFDGVLPSVLVTVVCE